MRSRRAALLVSLALLAGSALAAQLPNAGAAVQGCPCVLLIEVDGLEPKDVTRETTPFLWELAHPNEGQLIEDTRAGWTWEAPRATMTAGTAANTAALLTGGYPKQTGAPSDEFLDPTSGDEKFRLEYAPLDGATQFSENNFIESESLLTTVPQADFDTGKKASAAFVGNPALSDVITIQDIPEALRWFPTNDPADGRNPPSPAYCETPRRTTTDPSYQPPCSAPDVVTLDKAVTALNTNAANSVALTYIHLAELGVIKRRDGDVQPPSSAPESGEQTSPAAQDSLPHALAQLDAALAQFFSRYKDQQQSPTTAGKWNDTFVMLVGGHGYETTPHVQRLPGGTDDDATGLEQYLERENGIEYSPYGTMATVYSTASDPAARRSSIQSIARKLEDGGVVESQPQCQQAGGCIDEVLFTREELLPAGATEAFRKKHLLSEAHPDWNLDHVERVSPFASTRISGDLLVVAAPGWSAGRPLPVMQEEPEGPMPVAESADPYLGSAGGPRNRAVAAIVNGPGGSEGVRQVRVDRYPVTAAPDNGTLDEDPEAKYDSFHKANSNDDPIHPAPEDDANADGHERQPETVDFAPTIGALLGVAITEEQLAGRFLQEAFQRNLAFPDPDVVEDVEEEVVVVEEPPPPTPAPEVIILPPPPTPDPPPPPKPWGYTGLIQNLRAAVGDKRGRIFPRVPARAKLSYLILRADFGKPLASVKLSFYKQQSSRRGRTGARRTVVKTLASFAPFSIKRAKSAKLTLKVPKVFKPTHVGVLVQQARKLSAREAEVAKRKKRPLFKAYGAKVGGIYRIKNARRLHTRAPKPAPRKRPRG